MWSSGREGEERASVAKERKSEIERRGVTEWVGVGGRG